MFENKYTNSRAVENVEKKRILMWMKLFKFRLEAKNLNIESTCFFGKPISKLRVYLCKYQLAE